MSKTVASVYQTWSGQAWHSPAHSHSWRVLHAVGSAFSCLLLNLSSCLPPQSWSLLASLTSLDTGSILPPHAPRSMTDTCHSLVTVTMLDVISLCGTQEFSRDKGATVPAKGCGYCFHLLCVHRSLLFNQWAHQLFIHVLSPHFSTTKSSCINLYKYDIYSGTWAFPH